jgi:hypothetical protein
MPSLKFTYGDVDAIKACIALAAGDQAVDVAPTTAARSVVLELDNKETLTDPNAIAKYLGIIPP